MGSECPREWLGITNSQTKLRLHVRHDFQARILEGSEQLNSMLSPDSTTFDTSSTQTSVDSMSRIFMFFCHATCGALWDSFLPWGPLLPKVLHLHRFPIISTSSRGTSIGSMSSPIGARSVFRNFIGHVPRVGLLSSRSPAPKGYPMNIPLRTLCTGLMKPAPVFCGNWMVKYVCPKWYYVADGTECRFFFRKEFLNASYTTIAFHRFLSTIAHLILIGLTESKCIRLLC